MSISIPRNVHSKFGAALATITMVVVGVSSSAASAQISTNPEHANAPLIAPMPVAKSIASPSQVGGTSTEARLANIRTQLTSIRPFVVFVDHRALETRTAEMNIDRALAEAHVAVGKDDIVLPTRHGALPADGIVHVQRVRTWTQSICSRIAPRSFTVSSSSMLKNTTRVQQTGKAGLRQTTIRFTSIDGHRARSRVLSSRVIMAARPRIIARGTAHSHIEVAERLNSLAINTLARTDMIAHAAMAMIATAYTAFCDGCSGTGRGATGMLVHHGVVAVDPRVIPLGSRLFIPGYGHAIAGDTGGAIIGRRIDLAFNSNADAIQFGRRPVTVYVLHH